VKNIKIKLLGLNSVKGMSMIFKFNSKIKNHREKYWLLICGALLV
jgi:hypothetical protein